MTFENCWILSNKIVLNAVLQIFYHSKYKSANTYLCNIYIEWSLGWIDLQLRGILDFSICGAFKDSLKGKLNKMNTNT